MYMFKQISCKTHKTYKNSAQEYTDHSSGHNAAGRQQRTHKTPRNERP